MQRKNGKIVEQGTSHLMKLQLSLHDCSALWRVLRELLKKQGLLEQLFFQENRKVRCSSPPESSSVAKQPIKEVERRLSILLATYEVAIFSH